MHMWGKPRKVACGVDGRPSWHSGLCDLIEQEQEITETTEIILGPPQSHEIHSLLKTLVRQTCAYSFIGYGLTFDISLIQLAQRKVFKWCTAEAKHRGGSAGSTAFWNQSILVRGYKICDRHTGFAWISIGTAWIMTRTGSNPYHLVMKIFYMEAEEAMTALVDDQNKEGDPSGSRSEHPLGHPNNSSSFASSLGKGGEISSTNGKSDGHSGPSDSSKMDQGTSPFSFSHNTSPT